MRKFKSLRIPAVALAGLLLSACGGGQTPVAEFAPTASGEPAGFHAQTGSTPRIAYAGSPVRKSRSYINSDAIEPGEDWIDMGGESVSLSAGYSLRGFETKRIIPILYFDYAPGRERDPELEAQVRRAFKLWTRYLTGVRGYDFRTWRTVVEVGHAGACGGNPNAVACVWDAADPANPYGLPVMQIPASQADLVDRANSPITLLSTLAHETGHALGYFNLVGYYDPATGRRDHAHAPPHTRQLMTPFLGQSRTIGPQIGDLAGVSGIFSYGPALSADQFGWWMDAPGSSDLRAVGAGVRRHFEVTELAGATDVEADSTSVTADVVTSDFIKVYSFVDGVPSEPTRRHLGSASWRGVLLAVDTLTLSPVAGRARLNMDLSAFTLSARFDNFVRSSGGEAEDWPGPESLRYTMRRNRDGVWHDALGRVDARFFASRGASGRVDPAHTVAGHLDDDRANILGAYGALREGR